MQELINSSDLKRKCIYWLVFRRYPSSLQSWSQAQPWTERGHIKVTQRYYLRIETQWYRMYKCNTE